MARASPASCLYRHNRHSLSHKHTLAHKELVCHKHLQLQAWQQSTQSNTSKLFCYKFDQTDSLFFSNITFHFQTIQAPPLFPLCCGPPSDITTENKGRVPCLKGTMAVVYKQALVPNLNSSIRKPLCHMLGSIRRRISLWALSLCQKQGNNIKSISGEEEQGTLGEFKTLYCP